jgi:glycosyltransferase involved in cell wall biosynthesis
MKLCFVCSEYPPVSHGGVGTMMQNLGRELVSRGHEVTMVGLYRQSAPVAIERDHGVQVYRLRMPKPRFGWVWARYKLYRTISNWVRQQRADLVEAPDYEGWTAYWPSLPVPVIVRLHGAYSYFAREMGTPIHAPAFRLERAGLNRADFYCSTSAYTARKTQELFGLKRGPSAILYCPANLPEVDSGAVREANRVVFTGTLTPKKGIVQLIEAWPTVRRSCPDAQLHVFGRDGKTTDGQSMTAYLRQRLNGDSQSVHFHGFTSHEGIASELQRAAVAIFPSYAEAFAIAPIEAMACGCATVYSTRGSGPELIESGRNGVLVDPGRPDEIAAAIAGLLRNPALARHLGDEGRARVKDAFSIARFTSANEEFYETCVRQFALHRG